MMKTAFLTFAMLSASSALGCECGPVSVSEAKKSAEVVFRGTITAISDGKVMFRVDRVWKGEVGGTFQMPEFTAGGSCLGFRPSLLLVGNDLLVFAWRLRRFAGDADYFTDVCTRTSMWDDAGGAVKKLGKGRLPRGNP